LRNSFKNISLVFGTIFFTLAFCEILLRFFYPQPVDYFYFPREPQPNSHFKRWGLDISLNSEGYRDVDHEIRKPRGVIRIAVIGDSITYGTGVPFEDIYHQKLQKLLNESTKKEKYEVLAFNQGAANTKWAIATYERSVRQFSPDVVILGFCLNDIENYDTLVPANGKRRLYDVLAAFHEYARVKSHLYFLIFERSRRLLYQYILDRTVRTADSWLPVKPESDEFRLAFDEALRSTMSCLVHFNSLVKADGARLIIVVFPFEMQLSSRHADIYAREYRIAGLENAPRGIAQDRLVAELRKRNIEYLDLLPTFQEMIRRNPRQALFFRELGGMLDWAHPNTRGHDIAARELLSFMLSNGLVK
jgi:lysophospholipase L1-like esterase